MASRRIKPHRQGRLDGLCGVYALINALRLLWDHPNTIHGLHFTVAIPFAGACHASPRRRRRRRRAPQAG